MVCTFISQRGETEYALSDYSRVAELDPKATEPLKRQAMHKYNKKYVYMVVCRNVLGSLSTNSCEIPFMLMIIYLHTCVDCRHFFL